MINNKLVTIVKDNQFDKGWTLFTPAYFEIERNPLYVEADLSKLIKQITYSTEVNLLLKDACLPSRVINELEWANDYININIISKSEDVIQRYKKLKFKTKKIDPTLNLNFIGIKGKDNGYYILGEELAEVDDTLEKIYFNSLKSDVYSFVENAKEIIIISESSKEVCDELINKAKKSNVKVSYVVNTKIFDRRAFDYAKKHNLNLYVSNYTIDSIIAVLKDNSLSRFEKIDDEKGILFPVKKLSTYLGELYKNLFLEDMVDTSKIPKDVYSNYRGEISKLEIVEKVTVERNVFMDDLLDFINEEFDSSLANEHNDYSNKAKQVIYKFTLIPPVYDKTYVESHLYDAIRDEYKRWYDIQTINFEKLEQDYKDIMFKKARLMFFIEYYTSLSHKFGSMVSQCAYKEFYTVLDEALEKINNYKDHLLDDCQFMFENINSESSGNKFDKFDNEIEGYRKTILEKNAQISLGIDVISNKRRVEILTKKIDDLLALKEKFESSASSRNSKETDTFMQHCKRILDDVEATEVDNDSIGKIVGGKDNSKNHRLDTFVTKYLKKLYVLMSKCIDCLLNMKAVKVPVDYPVYEKNEKRYIVIKELEEYAATKDIQKEFNVKCLVRR